MNTGKYVITKTTESRTLRTRILITEGDDGFGGTLVVTDETGQPVQRTELGPEDLDPIVQQLTGLKSRAVADSGAVFIADETAEIVSEVKK